ncbi:MAG: hypothetical protein ABI397_00815 [Candidatus Saccharimonas sp.]
MTELDFDEIDKAVGQALTKPSGGAEPSKPDMHLPKRRGQYMDFVRQPSSARGAAGGARHTSLVIPSREPKPVIPETPEVVGEVATTDEAEKNEDINQPTDDDTTSFVEHSSEIPAEAKLDESFGEDNSADFDFPAPLDSPFLPDAKPDKRPLGGLQDQDTSSDLLEDSFKDEYGEKNAQVNADPTSLAAAAIMPDELRHDVNSIETTTTHPHEEAEEDADNGNNISATVTEAVETSSANGSITQQYAEKPSSGDQTSGAIYDTSSYHQGLEAKQERKMSTSVKFILWAVVLLMVGMAFGAAYFVFKQ